jgi:hypothetical protein
METYRDLHSINSEVSRKRLVASGEFLSLGRSNPEPQSKARLCFVKKPVVQPRTLSRSSTSVPEPLNLLEGLSRRWFNSPVLSFRRNFGAGAKRSLPRPCLRKKLELQIFSPRLTFNAASMAEDQYNTSPVYRTYTGAMEYCSSLLVRLTDSVIHLIVMWLHRLPRPAPHRAAPGWRALPGGWI